MKRNASKGFRDLFLNINHYRIGGVALLSLLVLPQFSCRSSVNNPDMAPELTLADLKFEDAEEQQRLSAHHLDTVLILCNSDGGLMKKNTFDTVGHIYYNAEGKLIEYFFYPRFQRSFLKNVFEDNGLVNYQITGGECVFYSLKYTYIFDPESLLLRKLAVYEEEQLAPCRRGKHEEIYTGDSVIYRFNNLGKVVQEIVYAPQKITLNTNYNYNASGKLLTAETKAAPTFEALLSCNLITDKSNYYYEKDNLSYSTAHHYYCNYNTNMINSRSHTYYDTEGLKTKKETSFFIWSEAGAVISIPVMTELFIYRKRKNNL